jgi:septin family protein
MPLDTKPFQLDLPKNGGMSICLLGSTRSGKTTFLTHLLQTYFDKHFKMLMSNSLHAPIYKEIETEVKCPVYSPKLVSEGYRINKDAENHYDLMYILDDVVSAKYDKELLKLLAIYRNSNLSCIISIQSPVLLNSATRGNLNIVMLGRMNSEEQIEKIIKMYLSSYLEGKMTDKIRQYKALTENHHWIIVNNLDGEIYRTKLNL